MSNKKTILVISDHAASLSGVGVQTKFLLEGLIKTGKYRFLQLGGAVKHEDYSTKVLSNDLIIKPIDGFGNQSLLRSVLINDKPEAIIIFQDPRFFTWLFEMESEIRQVCPILWWHVWDNKPTPRFNDWMYEAVDAINCHSYLTYKMCSENFKEKSSFIPHSFPENVYYRLSDKEILAEKERILGSKRKNNFVALWVNRNCKRKRPADVLLSWKLFLEKKNNTEDVTLIMHTDPYDNAGTNLVEVAKHLDILNNVSFSVEKLDFEHMNILNNIADVALNISFHEGFGLNTLTAMMTGTPIIANKTGGLYRQVVDHRDGSINGVALDYAVRTIVGTQSIPYIYEDYVCCHQTANALEQIFNMPVKEYNKLSKKVERYAKSEFGYQKTIDLWEQSLDDTILNFNNNKEHFNVEYLF